MSGCKESPCAATLQAGHRVGGDRLRGALDAHSLDPRRVATVVDEVDESVHSQTMVVAVLFMALLSRFEHPSFPDLVHHWPADGNADDVAGAAHGVLHGDVSYVEGRRGLAFYVAPGGYVDFGPEPGVFGAMDFTLSFWCRLDESMHAALLAKRAECDPVDMFELRVKSDGDLIVEAAGAKGSGSSLLVTRKAALDDGAWRHVAWRREGGVQTIFVDGCVLVTPVGGKVAVITTDASLLLGRSPCTGSEEGEGELVEPFTGAVDEIQLYARALDSAELRALAGWSGGGDLDRSGAVDGADLGALLQAWGDCGACCPADLDGDDMVGAADIGLLLAAWTGSNAP